MSQKDTIRQALALIVLQFGLLIIPVWAGGLCYAVLWALGLV